MVKVKIIEEDDFISLDPLRESFINVNTPEELLSITKDKKCNHEMKIKIIFYLFFIVPYLQASFYVQESHSKNFSEDEQLIWVGIGAFKDGFYDIAEKQFSNFIKIYPKHDKVFDIYYLLGRTLLIKGKLKEAKGVFSKIINEGKNFENMDYTLLGMAEVGDEIRQSGRGLRGFSSRSLRDFHKFDQIDYSYYLLGLLELGSNQLTPAESTFKKVSQYSKNNESHSFFLFLVRHLIL